MADQKIAIIINAKDDATKTIGGIGNALGGLGKVAAGLALGAAAGIGAVGYGIARLAMDAAKIEPVRIGFENLSASIGTTAEAMLIDLRQATRGMIADADLMKAGSKLMAMGLADSSEEAAKLAGMASKLGMAMGEDAGASIENFTLMLANQSIPRLDSFGISSAAVRARIEELTAATEGMTREEAFMIAVMEQGDVAMAKIGETGGGAQESFLQLQASLSNLKTSIGTAFIPVLNAMLKPLVSLVQEHGPAIQAWTQQFATWLETIAIPAIVAFATSTAWPAIKAAASVVFTFFSQVMWPWMKTYFGWLSGTAMPAIQWAFENVWPRVRDAVVGAIDWIVPKLEAAYAILKDFWVEMQPKLSSAFEEISRVIREELAPRFAELWEKSEPARKVLGQIAAQIAEWIAAGGLWMLKQNLDAVINAFDAGVVIIGSAIQAYKDIKRAIEGVVGAISDALIWIGNLKRSFENLIIPDWLRGHSPSPLEQSIRGIGAAIRDLPSSIDVSARMTPAFAGGFAPGGGGTTNSFNITIQANDYAGGRAAGRGLVDALRERGLQIG